SDAQHEYKGHTYVTSFALPEQTLVESGEIELEPQTRWPNLLLSVFRVSLVDASLGKSYPLSRESIRVESTTPEKEPPPEEKGDRWKLLARAGYVDIYQNARALPRAWLAPDARVLDDPAMLQVIRTGFMPDGSRWDPLHTALVEAEPATPLTATAQGGRVEITGYEPNQVNLQTRASGNSLLVLSENDY